MHLLRFLCVLAAVGITPAQVYLVPWKTLNPGTEPVKGELVLYWIPASRDDMRHSELLTSRTLTMYASQCIGMQIVRPDDYPTIDRLHARDALPVAILVDAEGVELARADSDEGSLRASSVEKMVRDELAAREAELDRILDEAAERAADDDLSGALLLYKTVAAQRCQFPKKARDAQRALKKLTN